MCVVSGVTRRRQCFGARSVAAGRWLARPSDASGSSRRQSISLLSVGSAARAAQLLSPFNAWFSYSIDYSFADRELTLRKAAAAAASATALQSSELWLPAFAADVQKDNIIAAYCLDIRSRRRMTWVWSDQTGRPHRLGVKQVYTVYREQQGVLEI